MARALRFLAAVTVATLGVGLRLCDLGAQTVLQTTPERRLPLPAAELAGLSGAYWRAAITNGGPMPRVERLLIVAPDGLVLGVADGDNDHVLVPEVLCAALSAGTVHGTLVHNHPGNVSLSGDDMAHLAKAGVDRVIAVGHDGSVFEATRSDRFDRETFATSVYPKAFAQVSTRLEDEARRAGVNPASISRQLSHLIAAVLDRAGVIHYRVTASLELKLELDRYRDIVDGTIRGVQRF